MIIILRFFTQLTRCVSRGFNNGINNKNTYSVLSRVKSLWDTRHIIMHGYEGIKNQIICALLHIAVYIHNLRDSVQQLVNFVVFNCRLR